MQDFLDFSPFWECRNVLILHSNKSPSILWRHCIPCPTNPQFLSTRTRHGATANYLLVTMRIISKSVVLIVALWRFCDVASFTGARTFSGWRRDEGGTKRSTGSSNRLKVSSPHDFRRLAGLTSLMSKTSLGAFFGMSGPQSLHGNTSYVLSAVLWLSTFGVSLERRTVVGKALSAPLATMALALVTANVGLLPFESPVCKIKNHAWTLLRTKFTHKLSNLNRFKML